MKPKSRTALLGVAIFIGVVFGAPTNAMRVPRIELLREVRVASANVLLSDLLPVGAGVSLRERSEGISLGAVPQAGNTRVLERSGVLEILAQARMLPRKSPSRSESWFRATRAPSPCRKFSKQSETRWNTAEFPHRRICIPKTYFFRQKFS